jgi:glucose/mannose-6-phosphate isomerase
VIITSGGQLKEIATEHGYPLVEIPAGLQPRMATFYNLSGLVQFLEPLGFVEKGSLAKLDKVAGWLGEEAKKLSAEVPAAQNPAKKLAQELVGSSIVVYSGPLLSPAAYKWKINFNENAKNIAWYGQYPEVDHNEILGWTSHPVDKPYKIVELRSPLEHKRVQKRFDITDRLLSGKRPSPEIITASGETILHQLLWTIQLGDFASIYLALLNGLNPSPVELIEKLKEQLSD